MIKTEYLIKNCVVRTQRCNTHIWWITVNQITVGSVGVQKWIAYTGWIKRRTINIRIPSCSSDRGNTLVSMAAVPDGIHRSY